MASLSVALLLPILPASVGSARASRLPRAPVTVSAQGRLCTGGVAWTQVSPGGRLRMSIAPQIRASQWSATLRISGMGDRVCTLSDIPGSAFFLSDLGCVVALAPAASPGEPATVRVFDLAGRETWRGGILGSRSPRLSADGRYWVCASDQGILRLDLRTLEVMHLPVLFPFAISRRGKVAGLHGGRVLLCEADGRGDTLMLADIRREALVAATERGDRPITAQPLSLAFGPGDTGLLLLFADRLVALDSAGSGTRILFQGPPGARLRDLRVDGERVLLGVRRTVGEESHGEMIVLDSQGAILTRRPGARGRIPSAAMASPPLRGIPWPLAPNEQHCVGNTYGQYQYYGGEPYLHPGIDVMGDPGDAVYAVHGGEVKAVLTTGGQWHWRVAISDSATAAPSLGYLYAHLEESSIAVDVGEIVQAGQYLGDLVWWPVHDFTHVHFARIRDEGEQWSGHWLCPENPHLDFESQSETDAPFFESAIGNDLLAFCANETSDYLDPGALQGEVDIIVHAADRIRGDWDCTVQEIRYTIHRLGFPEFPVVDDRLAVRFDMLLDTYQGGPIDPFLVQLLYKHDATCQTEGDYDTREFFHVITNSDGDEEYEESDRWEAWDTRVLPDGDYLVRVMIADVAGNLAADSMVVTTANGDPAAVPAGASAPWLAWASANPARGGSAVSLDVPATRPLHLAVLDSEGRLVRRIHDGPLPAGSHRLVWDGRSARGPAAAGVYFWHLTTAARSESRRIVLTGK